MGMMRIFIASADERLRLALHMLLDHEPGMVVVGLSDRLPGLVTQLNGALPDVLLLDWELSNHSLVELIHDFHNLESHPKAIVLSINPKVMKRSLEAGADAFVSKEYQPDLLLEKLRQYEKSLGMEKEANRTD